MKPIRTNLRVDGSIETIFEELGRIGMLATSIHRAPGMQSHLTLGFTTSGQSKTIVTAVRCADSFGT